MRSARGWRWAFVLAGLATARAAEPVLEPGDMATVKVEKAEIRQGQDVKAWLEKGQRVKIYAVQGHFALVPYVLNGRSAEGYIKVTELDPPQRSEQKSEVAGYTFKVDDEVVVQGKEAKLMLGKDVLGAIPGGSRLKVQKVNDQWLQVCYPVNGKETVGWVHSRDVDYPAVGDRGRTEPPPPKGGETKGPPGK